MIIIIFFIVFMAFVALFVFPSPIIALVVLVLLVLLLSWLMFLLNVIHSLLALLFLVVYLGAMIIIFSYISAVTPNVRFVGLTHIFFLLPVLLGFIFALVMIHPSYSISRVTYFRVYDFIFSSSGVLFFMLLVVYILFILFVAPYSSLHNSTIRSL